MMALALITSLVRSFDKIEKLEDRIEAAGNIPRAIETFEEYYAAYKTGYPYDAKNFAEFAKNPKDKETLEIWSLLVRDIEELQAKDYLKPNIEELSLKSALQIAQSACLYLDQEAREELQEEEEEEQTQKR